MFTNCPLTMLQLPTLQLFTKGVVSRLQLVIGKGTPLIMNSIDSPVLIASTVIHTASTGVENVKVYELFVDGIQKYPPHPPPVVALLLVVVTLMGPYAWVPDALVIGTHCAEAVMENRHANKSGSSLFILWCLDFNNAR